MKPKILITTSSYPKWENETSGVFVEELCKRLTDSFDVFVLTPYSHNSLTLENRNNLNVTRYKYWIGKKLLGDGEIMANLKQNKLMYFQILPFMLLQLINIYKIVKKQKINIIHAHWLIPQALMAVIYKKLFNRRISILATIHGGDINNFNGFLGRLLIKYILKNIDSLTVVSEAIKQKILVLDFKKEIYVYPMGVDTELFSPDKKDESIRKKFNIAGNFLLFVGSINERKGIRHLIEAMPLILKKFPGTKLLVVGDGNLKNEMVELLRTLDVSDNVIFTGAIPHNDLPPYFATADVFVLPSFSEGFGLVVAEALSSATIVITSDLKPINDIIIENKTGFYFQTIDKISISDKIIEVLNNLSNIEHIKKEGRTHIVNNFDWESVTNKYLKLFNKLLSYDKYS